jgi:hypothetical protein
MLKIQNNKIYNCDGFFVDFILIWFLEDLLIGWYLSLGGFSGWFMGRGISKNLQYLKMFWKFEFPALFWNFPAVVFTWNFRKLMQLYSRKKLKLPREYNCIKIAIKSPVNPTQKSRLKKNWQNVLNRSWLDLITLNP